MCLVDVVTSLGCAYIYTYMPTVKQLQAGSSGGILQDTNVMTEDDSSGHGIVLKASQHYEVQRWDTVMWTSPALSSPRLAWVDF